MFCFSILEIPLSAVNTSNQYPVLFKITQKGKIGFIDKNGKVVIKPQFDDAVDFSEGLTWVAFRTTPTSNTFRWSLIDTSGKQILKGLNLEGASEFKNGIASIVTESSNFGFYNRAFINKSGKAIAKYSINKSKSFSEGLLPVNDIDVYNTYDIQDNKWGYVDISNNNIIQPQYYEASTFSEGLACVNYNGKMGYINNKGETVIEPQFRVAGDFHENLAPVGNVGDNSYFTDDAGYLSSPGYYTMYGMLRTEVLGETLVESSDCVSVYSINLGFIDKTGKYVIEPQFDKVRYFSEGLACVSKNGLWGYIDKNGKVISDYLYSDAHSFSGGLAAVYGDNDFGEAKWGFINKSGSLVVPLMYDSVEDVRESLAAVKINDKWGFINTKGKLVIKPEYRQVKKFKNGLCYVYKNDKPMYVTTGYINTVGKWVWKDK